MMRGALMGSGVCESGDSLPEHAGWALAWRHHDTAIRLSASDVHHDLRVGNRLLLVSANWFADGIWFSLGLVVSALIHVEEATLIETFGATYRAYMRPTGRRAGGADGDIGH